MEEEISGRVCLNTELSIERYPLIEKGKAASPSKEIGGTPKSLEGKVSILRLQCPYTTSYTVSTCFGKLDEWCAF